MQASLSGSQFFDQHLDPIDCELITVIDAATLSYCSIFLSSSAHFSHMGNSASKGDQPKRSRFVQRPSALPDLPPRVTGGPAELATAVHALAGGDRPPYSGEEPGARAAFLDLRHSELGTVVDVTDVPALQTGRIGMDFFERCFIALTVVGSLGVIAIVIWILMH